MVSDLASQLAMNKTATCVAVAATCSPAWLPSLSTVSTTCAELLPVVGIIYLTLQAIHFVLTKRWKRSSEVASKDETS